MKPTNFNTKQAAAAALLVASCAGLVRAAGLAESWEGAPYRISASLAIDAPGDLGELLAAELPGYLAERANTAIGAVWRIETGLASGPLRSQMLRGLERFGDNDVVDAAAANEDKRLLLSVRSTPWGYELAAREYDRYVERWGPTIRRSTRQREAVAEQLFELAAQAVAPLAHLRTDPNNPRQVVLELRGSDLPPAGADFSWSRPGDVFQPILRRTTRAGELVPGSVAVIPWTYVEVATPADGAMQPVGTIRGFSQRPLGVRRGRIEQVAIGMRNDPGDTVLELHSRSDKQKPLVGYEAFAQDADKKPMRPLGESDARGDVTVTPGKSAVQMVYIKSGDLTISALPVVPGAEPRVEVPLPDDDMRLRAAARLAALREDVVDLVARRTILMARVRQQINEEHLDVAADLLQSLDDLPGPTDVSRDLDWQSHQLRTSDVQVQRRIDRLFAETRKALGKFLDPQEIATLHEELRQAQASSQESNSAGDKPTS